MDHKADARLVGTSHPTRRSTLVGVLSAGAYGAVFPTLTPAAMAQAAQVNPYAGKTNIGPSCKPVPQIGATPAVPNSPFITPAAGRWSSTSLLNVGNDVGGYRMVGLPDGLGAFDNGDRTLTVLMNHEVAADKGNARGHGGTGAFVSRWLLNKDSLEILSGRDLVDSPANLFLWSDGQWKPSEPSMGGKLNINRLCSADLAPRSAVYNAVTRKGYDGHLFLNGEEAGGAAANRAFAFVPAQKAAYELPAFAFGTPGDAKNPPPSWENLVANPASGDATLVMAMSDGGSNQVYVFLGAKRTEGSPIERAGLTDGRLFSLLIAGVSAEDRTTNVGLTRTRLGSGPSVRVGLAAPNKGTSFLRPEDGVWDPRNPRIFYFVTTDRNNFSSDGTVRDKQDVTQIGRSRLWVLTFDKVTEIETDGSPMATLQLLLDGTEGGDMFDNVTMDSQGTIYLCEDSGNSRHNGKVWSYDTNTGDFSAIMKCDPEKFGDIVERTYTPPTAPFVDDKETSGVIDVTSLFSDAVWFKPGSTVLLIAFQAHFPYDTSDKVGAELVEGGQLLLLVKAP